MSTSRATDPVLIVGAGPAGLVLALTLVKNDVPVRIIEKDQQFHNGQRGSGIMPRSLEVYNFLGVLPDILARGRVNPPARAYKLPGGTETAKDFEMMVQVDPTPAVPNGNAILIGQATNEEILRSHLAKYKAYVELGTELSSFEQDVDGVTVHILKRNGREETQETIRVSFLAGTDGAKGVVRKQLGLTFIGETRDDDRLLIADVYIKGLDSNLWHMWGSATTKMAVLRPTETDGLFTLLGSGKVDYQQVLKDRSALQTFLNETTGRTDLQISDVQWTSEYRANIRVANKFGEGRVFIAGDAAHVHSPTGGQGLNSSNLDSFNLGWKLALVHKGLSPLSLLETYTSERLPVIQEMLQRTTVLLNRTMSATNIGQDASVWNRGNALKQLGVHYRWSDIVVDEQPEVNDVAHVAAASSYGAEGEGEKSLYAGDRAPDAPGLLERGRNGGSTSLFKIFSPSRHIALFFTSDNELIKGSLDVMNLWPAGAVQSVVVHAKGSETATAAYGTAIVVEDSHGHAHAEYPMVQKGFPIIIVRPDGAIGAVVKDAEGVQRYGKGIFGA